MNKTRLITSDRKPSKSYRLSDEFLIKLRIVIWFNRSQGIFIKEMQVLKKYMKYLVPLTEPLIHAIKSVKECISEIGKQMKTDIPLAAFIFLCGPYYKTTQKKDKTEIELLWPQVFELYVFAKAIRNFIIAADQFPAAVLLDENKHLQFSLFAFYNSSYHALTSFLGCHGIFFDKDPKGPPKIVKQKTAEHEMTTIETAMPPCRCILAKYDSGSRTWQFIPSDIRHRRRWLEFKKLLLNYVDLERANNFPSEFLDFLQYLNNYRAYTGQPSLYLRNAIDLKQAIHEICNVVPDWRHKAIYEDYAMNDVAYELWVNKDMISIPEYSFRYKVQALRNLAVGMLKWQCQVILDMWTEISNSVDKESFQEATLSLHTLADLPPIRADVATDSTLRSIDPRIGSIIRYWYGKSDNIA